MSLEELKNLHKREKHKIKTRLNEFRSLSEQEYCKEFLFCILTPQSNAQRCWEAVEQISSLRSFEEGRIREILKSRTRFHNNKTIYLLEALRTWNKIQEKLNEENTKELRNWLADSVKGYGLKEASHFLRNIGKSENKLAILDRHILRNLVNYGIIKDTKIKGRKDYLEKEQKYLDFAGRLGIHSDELDLLFWSRENGEIFK